MTNLTHYRSLLFFLSCFSLHVTIIIAGSRPVHGPSYTNPSSFSPQAYDFFHPKSSLPDNNNPPLRNSPSSPSPSPSPSKTSNNIESSDSHGSKVSSDEHTTTSEISRREQEGRRGTLGVVLGLSFAAFLLIGVYFVIKKRRDNITRTIVIHSHA
ncbi:unnamed protein product [Cochlearia groenlandica]